MSTTEPSTAAAVSSADAASSEAPSQPHPRTWVGILGVIIALTAPALQPLLRGWFESYAFPMDRFLSLVPLWVAAGVAVGLSYFVEGYPLSTFGFRGTGQKTLRARLIEWILMVVVTMVVGSLIIFFSQTVRGWITGSEVAQQQINAASFPYWVLIPAWLTAWFIEETLYRGYAIERLILLTGRPWLAGAISSLTFTAFHLLAWDWLHIATVVFPASVLLTLVYLWKRSLVWVMVIHGIMAAPLLLLPLIAPYI
jgi:uncharacterized protein